MRGVYMSVVTAFVVDFELSCIYLSAPTYRCIPQAQQIH
jgi:hypothetical protein